MYLNVKPDFMSYSEWEQVTNDMAKTWGKYVNNVYDAVVDQLHPTFPKDTVYDYKHKVKYAFNPDVQYEFMASFLGATEEQKNERKNAASLLSPNILEISTQFQNDVGIIIQYREIKQLLTQGQAFSLRDGIDYRQKTLAKPENRLWWIKSDYALNIATNNNRDYPKDNIRNYYDSSQDNILVKCVLNVGEKKSIQSFREKMLNNPGLSTIFAISRYRKADGEFSRATTALVRLEKVKKHITESEKPFGMEWNKEELFKHPLINFINNTDTKLLRERLEEFMPSLNSTDEVTYNAYLEYEVLRGFLLFDWQFPIQELEDMFDAIYKEIVLKETLDQTIIDENSVVFDNYLKGRRRRTPGKEVEALIREKITEYLKMLRSIASSMMYLYRNKGVEKIPFRNYHQFLGTLDFSKGKSYEVTEDALVKATFYKQDVLFNIIRELFTTFENKRDYTIAYRFFPIDTSTMVNAMNSLYSLYKVNTDWSSMNNELSKLVVFYFVHQLNPSVRSR
jgi:hypothetical protein